MFSCTQFMEGVDSRGYAIVEGVVASEKIEQLRHAISQLPEGDEIRRRTNVYGVRNLLEVSEDTRRLAASPEIRALVSPVLGPRCFAVRATFFDKVPNANWHLRLHQDSVISVRRRVETPGYSAWSVKAGATQVRPPEDVLAEMLAIRVHLDDCPAQNGALRVLAGSHNRKWSRDEIPHCKSQFQEVVCEVNQGGVLAMRPLVLHASASSTTPAHRRVIHLEFACRELPGELDWKQRVTA